jgi:hypothetical protein
MPPEASPILQRFCEDVQEMMLRLRQEILAAAPAAHEIVLDAGYTVSIHFGPRRPAS